MRDFLKVRNEANSKRRKKSKDEPRKNASDGQKIILRRKTRKTPRSAAKSAPIHATYHSKDGIVIKTLRCVKCGGFVSAGKPECNRCIALQKSEQGKTHSSKGDKLKTVSKVSPSCRISMKTMKKQAPIRKKSTQQKKIIAIPKKMNPKLSNDPKILATKTSRKSVDNSKSPKKKVNGIMAPKKKTRINPNGKTYKENFQATKSKDLSKHSLNLSEKKNLADHNVDNIPKRKIQFNTLSTDISTSGDHRPTKESFLRYLDLGQTCSHVEYDTETHVGLADLLLDSNMISEECMSLLDSPNIEIIQEKDKDC